MLNKNEKISIIQNKINTYSWILSQLKNKLLDPGNIYIGAEGFTHEGLLSEIDRYEALISTLKKEVDKVKEMV